MAIPGINFFNGDENNVKPNNSAAPQFMNTIFGAEPTGGAGMDAFVATEPAETATEVDASEAAEPADPSEAPKRTTKKTSYKQIPKISATTSATYPSTKIDPDLFAKAVNNVIEKYLKKSGKSKSVMTGTGNTYLKIAKEKGVNPFILIAINIEESAYGTSKAALNKNNVGGLMQKGKTMYCKSVSDSISISANVLNKNVYDKNLTNLRTIGTKGNYCCAGQAGREKWINNIVSYATKIQEEYNRLLSGNN